MAYKIKRPIAPYYIPLSDKIEKHLDNEWGAGQRMQHLRSMRVGDYVTYKGKKYVYIGESGGDVELVPFGGHIGDAIKLNWWDFTSHLPSDKGKGWHGDTPGHTEAALKGQAAGANNMPMAKYPDLTEKPTLEYRMKYTHALAGWELNAPWIPTNLDIESIKNKITQPNVEKVEWRRIGDPKIHEQRHRSFGTEKKLHRYYYSHRPPSIGTQPDGFINSESWMPMKTTSHGRMAFGWVEYDRPLTPEELHNYELFEDEPELPKLVKEIVQFAHDEGIEEAMKALDKDYGMAVWNFAKSQKRLKGNGQKEQIRNEIIRLAKVGG